MGDEEEEKRGLADRRDGRPQQLGDVDASSSIRSSK
jgi:hypothetical protein